MPPPIGHDTAPIPIAQILAQLEKSELRIQRTAEGSVLETHAVAPPPVDRRQNRTGTPPPGGERRGHPPVAIPTLFPETGPILILVVAGFADDAALSRPTPFWEDDEEGGSLVWQALAKAGLLHKRDAEKALGQGGFWEAEPARTKGLALTYAGYHRRGGILDFEQVIRPWNHNRLQTLAQECWHRSMKRLKVIALGEAARFMMSACLYGLPEEIPLLAIPAPTPEGLEATKLGRLEAEAHWIEWASNLFEVGRS